MAAIHEKLKESISKGIGLQELADLILEKGKELAQQKLLSLDHLHVALHKIKSKDWNVLLIRYRKSPWLYHVEVKLVPEQTSLAL